MSLVTELSGEKLYGQIGGTKYKCQGTVGINLRARYANGRGSGDATPRPKAIGLEDGASIELTVISNDWALLSLNGQEVTNCDVYNDTTTVLGAFTGNVNVSADGELAGMVTFKVSVTPLTMPPVMSQLDY